MEMILRKEIEDIIKKLSIHRERAHEVSKLSYKHIIRSIEDTFVAHGGTIHWANMGHYKQNIPCKMISIIDDQTWYHALKEVLPQNEPVYMLFEDIRGYDKKYWLYEMYIPELIMILDEISGLHDFYIVSKKFTWLISENHEEVISILGDIHIK